MKPENSAFPHPDIPFLPEPKRNPQAGHRARVTDTSELHRGSWHKATQKARSAGPTDVLAAVTGCRDGVTTDVFGRLGLVPFNFTLGIFNKAACTKKEAWVTICCHPDDNAEASLHKASTTSFQKIQNHVLRTLWKFLCCVHAELHLEMVRVPKALREQDHALMEPFLALQQPTCNDSHQLNLRRMHLRIELLSETCNPEGNDILQEVWQ